ncbi:uncharacterized protein LOC108668553 [Hyalella azteca]|uniref:Uncharacterized protein LOC108668553 n=1 Tax=Hyalella azteca TaxID=294128 RepID=A0A8B7NCF8_HYAAZ|nr:uncharacterized protein LOC108668553 [Hyalella azteca]
MMLEKFRTVMMQAVLIAVVVLCQASSLRPAPRKLEDLPESVSLLDISTSDIDFFLSNQRDVELFTECFLDLTSCTSRPARSLIREILKLGLEGECRTCSQEEQEILHAKGMHFIEQYSTKYRAQWRRVIPRLGFLLRNSQ